MASREAAYPLLDQEKYVHVITSLGWSMSYMQIKKDKRTYTARLLRTPSGSSMTKVKRSQQS